jgi:lipopolysaccharide/colanic/teichoic acid biosynthesis glycosyltransferase
VDEVFLELQPNSYYLDSIVHQLSSMGITIHIKLAEKIEIDGQRQFVEKMGKYTVLTTSINSATTMQFILKRLIDIVGGAIGCVLTGILFIFIAPVIYYESPGPVIFSQTRIGRNGKKFKLYKFRSMYPDAELYKDELRYLNRNSDGMMFKLDYDPRIIGCYRQPDGSVKKGIGNFLRDWSLDEFPQFWNVLKGDMSLVGTRPPTEDEWEKYDLHHRSRLSIKPGITGMWQVNGRSRVTNFEQVVEMDRYYILNWNLGLDFKILAKTVPQVVGRSGAM